MTFLGTKYKNFSPQNTKSRIQEALNLSTDADISTNTKTNKNFRMYIYWGLGDLGTWGLGGLGDLMTWGLETWGIGELRTRGIGDLGN